MNAIKHPVATSKKFIADHPVATAMIITATSAALIQRVGLKQHDDFLKEHGLFEKFYTPEG